MLWFDLELNFSMGSLGFLCCQRDGGVPPPCMKNSWSVSFSKKTISGSSGVDRQMRTHDLSKTLPLSPPFLEVRVRMFVIMCPDTLAPKIPSCFPLPVLVVGP